MALKVEFPQGKIYVGEKGRAYLKYNKSYVNKFNNKLNKTQVYLDNLVIKHLMQYVSYKTGTQGKTILLTSDVGSGLVHINVPYAEYQAYSKKIKKRAGKRGTQPFERMCADNKNNILKQVTEYARRINNG